MWGGAYNWAGQSRMVPPPMYPTIIIHLYYSVIVPKLYVVAQVFELVSMQAKIFMLGLCHPHNSVKVHFDEIKDNFKEQVKQVKF